MTRITQNSIDDFAASSIVQTSKSEILELDRPGESEVLDNELSKSLSHVKRFFERWQADPDFREQVSVDPYQAIAQYNLKVAPEEIRSLWDIELTKKLGEKATVSPLLNLWWEFEEKFSPFKIRKTISTSLKEPHFKVWRERQIARTASQFTQSVHKAIIHFPVCFELSKGCSVGCWFCGVSAPRLNDIFIYNQENAKMWHEVLELMKELLGPAAGAGSCYWATDPLDNPDYEKFCSDFHAILGAFPPTTTAQPMKDPVRTRALLKLSTEKGCLLNCFSILSLKMLNQVHKEFSAEELTFVRLVLHNKEANKTKANAGRVRERNIKKGKEDSEFPEQGTIACVTGFLFNMVDRTVKLISPCNANDRWPLGYIVYDEGTFADTNELKILLERMIANHMPSTVKPSDLISFRRDLKYEALPDGFQLSNKLKTFKFRHAPYLKELGETIHKGGKTAEEIASIFNACGVSPAYIFYNFNLMIGRGILDEEPKPKSSELMVQ
jgi:radical SAM family RiPP maturation amino acid epimerase